jgi:hypothetical protein
MEPLLHCFVIFPTFHDITNNPQGQDVTEATVFGPPTTAADPVDDGPVLRHQASGLRFRL